MSKKLTVDFMKYIRSHHDPEEAEQIINDFEKNPEAAEVACIIAQIFGVDSPFEEKPESPKGEQAKEDLVNHPKHYTAASVQLEPIDVLRYAPFDLGNALKYILRAPHKGNALLDYQKALKYLNWAKQSAVSNESYQNFFSHYGLLLNKFEAFKGINFNGFDEDIIGDFIKLVEAKMKELQK